MTTRGASWIVLGIPLVIAAVRLFIPAQPNEAGKGFVTMVNEEIAKENLIKGADGVPVAPKDFTPEQNEYARKSALNAILASNNWDYWRFYRDKADKGEKVALQAYVSTPASPNSNATQWDEAVLFRQPVQNFHRQQEQPLVVDVFQPDRGKVTLSFIAQPSGNSAGTVNLQNIGQSDLRSMQRYVIACRDAGSEEIIRIGDKLAVIRRAPQRVECPLSVNGKPIADGVAGTFIWPQGIDLSVDVEGKGRFWLRQRPNQSVRWPIVWRGRDGLRHGQGEDPSLGLEQFSNLLNRELPAAMPNASGLSTTLDYNLQKTLQEAMAVDAIRASANARTSGDVAIVMAATLMDADTGEVLAMAGVNERQPVPGKLADEPNFILLPIGSAMKPIFSAAILEGNPGIDVDQRVDIELFKGSKANMVGNYLFSTPLENDFFGLVNFNNFIKYSPNAYMAWLLLQATPEYQLCSAGSNVCNENRALYPMTSYPWQKKLTSMFGLNIGHPYDQGGDDMEHLRGQNRLHDTSLWQSGGKITVKRLSGLAPEREQLGLSREGRFEQEVLGSALGGVNGKLTTVKLAETYARIITNRQVVATLLPLTDRQAGGDKSTFTSSERGVHAILLRALKTPLEDEGTASTRKGFRPEIGNCIVDLYAKTGTTTIQNGPRDTFSARSFVVAFQRPVLQQKPGKTLVLAINFAYRGAGSAPLRYATTVANSPVFQEELCR